LWVCSRSSTKKWQIEAGSQLKDEK
jgi:hypothetical protein